MIYIINTQYIKLSKYILTPIISDMRTYAYISMYARTICAEPYIVAHVEKHVLNKCVKDNLLYVFICKFILFIWWNIFFIVINGCTKTAIMDSSNNNNARISCPSSSQQSILVRIYYINNYLLLLEVLFIIL